LDHHLPVQPDGEFAGFPRILRLPTVPKVKLRVAPNLRSLCIAFRWVIRFPRAPHLPALPLLRLRASPNPASTAGLMMTPRVDSNFASSGLAGPRMNLRVQSGLAHSRLTLDAISVSSLPYCAGYAGSVKRGFHPIPHRPARLELRFQFPTGPSLGKECGPVRSVEASAKLAVICGFHQGWCIKPRKVADRAVTHRSIRPLTCFHHLVRRQVDHCHHVAGALA
jgi:hypothetical protein